MKKIISPLLLSAAFVLLLLACTKNDDPVDPPATAPSIKGTWSFAGITASTENRKIEPHDGDTVTTVFTGSYISTDNTGTFTIDSTYFFSDDLHHSFNMPYRRDIYHKQTLVSSDTFRFGTNIGYYVKSAYKLNGKDSISFQKGLFGAVDGTLRTVRLGESSRGIISIVKDTLLLQLQYYGYRTVDSGYIIISQGYQRIKMVRKK